MYQKTCSIGSVCRILCDKKSLNIMKISVLFLFVAIFSVSAKSYSQEARVTFDLKNVSVNDVFETIREQTNYSFWYDIKDVNVDRIVSLKAENNTVRQVLKQLLKNENLDYRMVDNHVVLLPKGSEPVITDVLQTRKITGTVRDGNNDPVIGANVVEKGTTNGSITDINGQFSLDVKPGAVILVSYIGYLSKEISVKEQTKLDILLIEDTKALDEVVIVGYGSQKKINLTGAVSSVKMDEVLGNRPVVSAANALIGAIPGLQITTSSGRPGGDMSFNIRGVNSINEAKPLVLVDNVEMDINMLDPNDIESVTVLKDAASSAIYGARAAFGVILVTTKKGHSDNSFSLNYSNNFSFSSPGNMPHKATPLQTVQAYKDMGTIAYQTGQNVDTWLGFLKEYEQNPSAYPDGYAMSEGLRYSLAETDLFEDMMETGFQQTHNISFGGGNKSISYRMSGGYVNQDGVLASDKDGYKRYNISSYIRSDAYSWITPELDIKYANSTTSMPSTSGGYGIWGAAVAFPSYFPLGEMELDGEMYPINTPRNLIDLSYPTTTKKNDIRVFGKVTVTPFKNLKLIGEYTFNRKSSEKTSFEKKFQYAHGANFRVEESVSNSKYQHSEGNTDYSAINFYANYSNKWGKHDFTGMAGFNQESNNYQYSVMSRTDMINEDLPSISQATGDYFANDEFKKFTVRGLFYRLNYSYDGKYLFETNARYDGSSKFPTSHRFGFFPSVSAGWRISEENFMDWSDVFLSNLKIRGSWGNIGNQSISPYAYIPGMDAEKANWIINGLTATTLKTPKLVSNTFTWEKVSTIDFGLDLGVFNNRLNLVYDWYQRDTKGMLAPGMELPGVLGADAPLQNTADLRSKGWEITVNWIDKIGNLTYNIGFNLYDSKSKITKYNNEVGLLEKSGGSSEYRTGMTLGEIWGYVTDRFYTTDDFDSDGNLKEGIARVEGYNPNPGDMLYKDFDGNGIINNGKNTLEESGDRKIIGNNKRRYQYGINGGVSWKDLSFSFILQGVGKRDLWVMNDLFYPHYDAWTTVYDTQLDYWTPERTNSYFPRLYEKSAGNTDANRMKQTHFLQDGSYLNIRNITLSYVIPAIWTNKLGVKRLSVFFSGENLYTFDHLPKGLDPETSVTDDLGMRGFTYPYMRQFSFGLNLTL
jgi:TonB-linked SusC/RagA family outer membrane protein